VEPQTAFPFHLRLTLAFNRLLWLELRLWNSCQLSAGNSHAKTINHLHAERLVSVKMRPLNLHEQTISPSPHLRAPSFCALHSVCSILCASFSLPFCPHSAHRPAPSPTPTRRHFRPRHTQFAANLMVWGGLCVWPIRHERETSLCVGQMVLVGVACAVLFPLS